MARRPRYDEPGMLHHVMNRGNVRRTVFETRADVRKFPSLAACCSRRHGIAVCSFAVMRPTTTWSSDASKGRCVDESNYGRELVAVVEADVCLSRARTREDAHRSRLIRVKAGACALCKRPFVAPSSPKSRGLKIPRAKAFPGSSPGWPTSNARATGPLVAVCAQLADDATNANTAYLGAFCARSRACAQGRGRGKADLRHSGYPPRSALVRRGYLRSSLR